MLSDIQDRQRHGLAIGGRIRAALQEQRLLFAFQPIVCAATGQVDYFECLLRMREASGKVVAGGALVAAAERAGYIGLIDRYVLDKTVLELENDPEVTLGFNVSGLTACDPMWLRHLLAVLHERPWLSSRIVVEITETAALRDLDQTAHFVGVLRNAGCRVALDDFGAGHTSLRHLQHLAVDTVKIDGSFVRDLANNPAQRVFLRHVLVLARDFGFRTVAECVESAEEAALVRAEGVEYLQGYHFGLPSTKRDWAAAPQPAKRAQGFG